MEVRLAEALGPVKLAVMDTATAAANRRLAIYGDKIPCKPGCAGCCSRMVRITMAEAAILYEKLVQDKLWLEVKKEARSQFAIAKDADPVAWFKTNRPCPVLDRQKNLCKAYSVRPAACSTHFVISKPELCDPWSTAAGTYVSADMDDLLEKFTKRVMENIAGHGVFSLELPIPVALLLAERISIQSGLELDKAVALLFQEFA
jgi:Fe-S-cluster containining protein